MHLAQLHSSSVEFVHQSIDIRYPESLFLVYRLNSLALFFPRIFVSLIKPCLYFFPRIFVSLIKPCLYLTLSCFADVLYMHSAVGSTSASYAANGAL